MPNKKHELFDKIEEILNGRKLMPGVLWTNDDNGYNIYIGEAIHDIKVDTIEHCFVEYHYEDDGDETSIFSFERGLEIFPEDSVIEFIESIFAHSSIPFRNLTLTKIEANKKPKRI